MMVFFLLNVIFLSIATRSNPTYQRNVDACATTSTRRRSVTRTTTRRSGIQNFVPAFVERSKNVLLASTSTKIRAGVSGKNRATTRGITQLFSLTALYFLSYLVSLRFVPISFVFTNFLLAF